MLEQLAYLYLANNKVSHTPDLLLKVLNADLKPVYVIQWQVYLFYVHLMIIFTHDHFYSILFSSDTLT